MKDISKLTGIIVLMTMVFVFSSCGEQGADGNNIINIEFDGITEGIEALVQRAIAEATTAENDGSTADKALNLSFTGFSTSDASAMNALFLSIEDYYVNLDLSGLGGATYWYYSQSADVDKSKIISLILSDNVTSIVNGANNLSGVFSGYTGLKSVKADGVVMVGHYAFYNCTELESVSLLTAESIGYAAFQNCQSLESVDFPVAESIGNYAFYNCTALESVSLPEAESIGYSTFTSCRSLEKVYLPLSKGIGSNAFESCFVLKNIELPATKSIGIYAFSNCIKLESVILLAVENIDDYAFSNCQELENVSFGDNAPTMGTGILSYINSGIPITVTVPSGATGYGSSPTDTTTQNWGNAFRGMGWDGTNYLSGTVNSNVALNITSAD